MVGLLTVVRLVEILDEVPENDCRTGDKAVLSAPCDSGAEDLVAVKHVRVVMHLQQEEI
jgi:hypothetical protein